MSRTASVGICLQSVPDDSGGKLELFLDSSGHSEEGYDVEPASHWEICGDGGVLTRIGWADLDSLLDQSPSRAVVLV